MVRHFSCEATRIIHSIPPEHQPDAFQQETNPVSGTQYPVLDTTWARLISIAVRCTWTVQPTPLEVFINIDGNAIIHPVTNPVSNTWYYCSIIPNTPEATQSLQTTQYSRYRAFYLEGRDIEVLSEITGGTVQDLRCRVKWARWP